ncbi:hypothetical protein BC936DRAFT_137465 [Jimgerdemannia flammicorona]|uniref:REJ domain-containing protein n=1 Tax=Jimgerdemannia flammicorona TaxID=994334 RepID=A0A433CXA3_9FUNG|nr:hypothetical protein BC936DRAFT_137465 [Jimgerdemannia flammicorona]
MPLAALPASLLLLIISLLIGLPYVEADIISSSPRGTSSTLRSSKNNTPSNSTSRTHTTTSDPLPPSSLPTDLDSDTGLPSLLPYVSIAALAVIFCLIFIIGRIFYLRSRARQRRDVLSQTPTTTADGTVEEQSALAAMTTVENPSRQQRLPSASTSPTRSHVSVPEAPLAIVTHVLTSSSGATSPPVQRSSVTAFSPVQRSNSSSSAPSPSHSPGLSLPPPPSSVPRVVVLNGRMIMVDAQGRPIQRTVPTQPSNTANAATRRRDPDEVDPLPLYEPRSEGLEETTDGTTGSMRVAARVSPPLYEPRSEGLEETTDGVMGGASDENPTMEDEPGPMRVAARGSPSLYEPRSEGLEETTGGVTGGASDENPTMEDGPGPVRVTARVSPPPYIP